MIMLAKPRRGNQRRQLPSTQRRDCKGRRNRGLQALRLRHLAWLERDTAIATAIAVAAVIAAFLALPAAGRLIAALASMFIG